ncbi:MAG: ATP-binding protein [Calditrichaeota bacterium]|nr:MAG: ATP-binding protein [Calditrichota bacterium]
MARFKTRARAVDMLGRQQIAGLPNAISELFKNAHDAYADRVEVDYIRPDNIFILRDDGIGMTKEDFEDRWLTLGTESKLATSKGLPPPPIDPDKKPRPILGEKGIGRLAIAAIGPQVLVLTRAKRNKKLHNLVAAFIHWGLFEAPGVNLDDVEIPIREFVGGTLPDSNDIQEMVEEVRQNVEKLKDYFEKDSVKKIIKDLEGFNINPLELADFLGKPSLQEDKNGGTHFYIFPASDNLAADVDADLRDEKVSKLRKLLLGFSNTMIPDTESPPIKTAFRCWLTYGQQKDLISEREFFTPEDFLKADHHIQGEFDELGQFKGTVTIYNEKPIEHVVSWPKALGKPVSCGPFKINIAYVMGTARESKLSQDEYVKISRKLDRISGLYIYRDGIRILPYGDSEFDFLRMEERRSKQASYYFFSYRRIFGAIEITREHNSNLIEKAGREGFQENKAYREFKDILINFFIQIAADFFREKGEGEYVDIFLRKKAELDKLERARREQEKQSAAARRAFSNDLESFFSRIQNGKFDEEIVQLLESFSNTIDSICKEKDADEGPNEILLAENRALRKLEALKNSLKIDKPGGVGLTRELKRDWQVYLSEVNRIEKEVIVPTQKRIREIVDKAIKETKFVVNRRRHVSKLLKEFITLQQKSLNEQADLTNASIKETQERIAALLKGILADMNSIIKEIETEFNKLDPERTQDEYFSEFRQKSERRLAEAVEGYKEILDHIRTQLRNITWSKDEEGHLIGEADMKAALEDEVLALREQTELSLEMTQLGMAIEIISHEFNNAIKAIRNNLRQLKAWADLNPELQQLYKNLRANFDHLDGYLSLFTPLNRRLYRKAVTITGAEIANYLKDLFGDRLERHKVQLVVTKAFRKKTIIAYPSTFYPVFVNLVDNSIFWLKDRSLPRKIELDANDDAFIVTDNGPGIPIRDHEAVFELGFTRKPGGQGLGLYVSRESLRKEGYELELEKSIEGKGATFRIITKSAEQKDKEL